MDSTKNKNIAFLKKQLEGFISYKRAQGYKYKSEKESLGRFIKFLEGFGISEGRLSKDAVLEYCSKRPYETAKNHANRVSDLRQFTIYLNEKGYQAYIPVVAKSSKYASSFVPYIFTHAEISRIFKEVDRLKPNCRYNCFFQSKIPPYFNRKIPHLI
jgi:site-specific recombinase XerD